MASLTLIKPNWPAPPTIHALTTTRRGGQSVGPYAEFNLAAHVGDNSDQVTQNRLILQQELGLSTAPHWLNQTHSNTVLTLGPHPLDQPPTADGSYTAVQNRICTVLTADCLPILLCNRQGTEVAAVHAGWRGCLGGILGNAVACFRSPPEDLLAWLGPAIGPEAYEVGQDLVDAFTQHNELMAKAFAPRPQQKYLANLYLLATLELQSLGVQSIYGGEHCTYTENKTFFSYRREEGITGRIASLIWIGEQR